MADRLARDGASRAAKTSSKQAVSAPKASEAPAAAGSLSELQGAVQDPFHASARDLLQLQRLYGNAAIQRLIGSHSAPPAEPGPKSGISSDAVQRLSGGESAASAEVGAEGGAIGDALQHRISQARGGGQSLPAGVGSRMGQALGADFSGVRVHADARADTLNRSLSARAFTLGSDIFFRQGAYEPHSHGGQKLLAHELTHVVQQSPAAGQRKYAPLAANKVQAKLVVGPAGDQYEQEADRVADSVMRNIAQPAREETEAPGAIRRSLSAKVSAGAVQRFYEIGNDKYTLSQDTSSDARAPFTRFESDLSIQKEGGKARGIGWSKKLDVLPPLNVAEDNTLAINRTDGEPKEFYATTKVRSDANQKLTAAGSPIQLVTAGNKITIPGKDAKTLDMMQPTFKGVGGSDKDDFVALTHTICRDSAFEIMGAGATHAILKDKTGTKAGKISTSDGQIISGINSLAKSLTEGDTSAEQGSESINAETKDKRSGAPRVGEKYGRAVRTGAIGSRAKDIGVNEGAFAEIGQGYLTQTIGNEDHSTPEKNKTDYSKAEDHVNKFIWGYHFSAALALSESGEDQIAMENYNRETSEMKAAISELLIEMKKDYATEIAGADLKGNEASQIGQILNLADKTAETAGQKYMAMQKKFMGKFQSHWYFRIIGKKAKQSFHEQMADSPFFVNPMTVVVAAQKISKQRVVFDEGSSTVNEAGIQSALEFGGQYTAAQTKGMAPKRVRVKGFGTGWKKTGWGAAKMGKKRAQAFADKLAENGVPTGALVVEGADGADREDKSKNRRVEVSLED